LKPLLVAIGTFHGQASILAVRRHFIEWLLTGEPNVSMKFDPKLGACTGEPFETTKFGWAPFTKLTTLYGVEDARKPISGLLIGGFAYLNVTLLGALHPSPIFEFNPALLSKIPFCKRRLNLEMAKVSSEWIQTPADWDSED
jgi:hypothetical protein